MHFGHLSVINQMVLDCEKVYVVFYHDPKIEKDITEKFGCDYLIDKRVEDAQKVLSYNKTIKVIQIDAPKDISFPENGKIIKEKIKDIVGSLDVQYIGLEEEDLYAPYIYADKYETAGLYIVENEQGKLQTLHAKDIRNNFDFYKQYLPKLIANNFS